MSDVGEQIDLWLDKKRGWCLAVPQKVPESALRIMVGYALTVYENEHRSMPDCARKRRLGAAIEDLIKLRVTQVILKQEDRDGRLIHPFGKPTHN